MDMIKKIAFTASTMLFLLAQIFSFYVIHVSRQDKIDLLKAQEEKVFSNCLSDMTSELGRVKKGALCRIISWSIVFVIICRKVLRYIKMEKNYIIAHPLNLKPIR